MSHLHIPDGVLPLPVWVAGLLLALVSLLVSAWATRRGSTRSLAFQGALGGLMLAVMAIPVPFAALEYCLTLTGPVGALLGAAAGFQVAFVVSAILALLGQGGFTVVGLNAVVMGSGAALARPVYRWLIGWMRPAPALAATAAIAQLASTALWAAILVVSVRLKPLTAAALHLTHGETTGARLGILLGVALPLLALGIGIEALVAYGLGRFLERVRPDLLPPPAAWRATAAASAPTGSP